MKNVTDDLPEPNDRPEAQVPPVSAEHRAPVITPTKDYRVIRKVIDVPERWKKVVKPYTLPEGT